MEVRIATIMTTVLIMALATPATDAGAEEKIYRWVDDSGAVHFGDMPPDNVAAEQITVTPDTASVTASAQDAAGDPSAPPAEPQPSYAEQLRKERADMRKMREEEQKKMAEECAKQRKLVAELEPSPRVIVKTEDGQIERLSDDLRIKTLDEAKTFIEVNCNTKNN